MMLRTAAVLLVLAAAVAGPALAAPLTEDQAKSKIQGAGYAEVTRLHQVNGGEWMANAVQAGRPVMVTLYPDGKVSLREQVAIPKGKPGATVPMLPGSAKP